MKLLKQNSFRFHSEERKSLEEDLLHLQSLFSDHKEHVRQAVNFYRRMFLTEDRDQTVNTLFSLNVFPRILELLQWHEFPEIQIQSSLILIELSSSSIEQVEYLLSFDLVAILCDLLVEQVCIPLVIGHLFSILGNISETLTTTTTSSSHRSILFHTVTEKRIFPYLLAALLRRDLSRSSAEELMRKAALLYNPNNDGLSQQHHQSVEQTTRLLLDISREYTIDLLQNESLLSKIIESLSRIQNLNPSLFTFFLTILVDCLAHQTSDYDSLKSQICRKIRDIPSFIRRDIILTRHLLNRLWPVFCRSTSAEVKKASCLAIVCVSLDSEVIRQSHLTPLDSLSDEEWTHYRFSPNLSLLRSLLLVLNDVTHPDIYRIGLHHLVSQQLLV